MYPLSDFDSAAQQFQVATGEADVICGVRAPSVSSNQTIHASNFLAGNHWRCGSKGEEGVHVPV